jgi:hypothetical protein
VKALEAENAHLKAELSQAAEKSAESEAGHRCAREEWLASCAKINYVLKDRTDAYQRHKAEAIRVGRQMVEVRAELEVMTKLLMIQKMTKVS